MNRAALLAALALFLAGAREPVVPPDQETEHVVSRGESLINIARRAEVPLDAIAEANGLRPPYVLRAGQKLVIPRSRTHVVERGDTGFSVAYTYGVPWRDIAIANGLAADAVLRPGQRLIIPALIEAPVAPAVQPSVPPVPAASPTRTQSARFAWPLAGPIRRGFATRGRGSRHDGIDITVAEGTPVRTAAAGRVLFAGREPSQFGNLVVVDHGGGWHSAYALLSRIGVREGQRVRQGDRIGLSGQTGMARGPELHFELRKDNRPVDPLPELPARP